MGYHGRFEDKLRAQILRKKGYSYKEILQEIVVSKDTLSRWCKDIVLTDEQKKRLLHNKQIGQKKGSQIAAENKRIARIERIELAKENGKIDIGATSKRDKFITGISLYAGEGDKTDGRGGFANADPLLIKFMCFWFVNFAKIPLEKLRGVVYIHEDLNENKAKLFWSKTTGIPLHQFRKSYIVKTQKRKFRKNVHEHGIFSIRFSDSEVQRKIMGWIYAIFNDRIEAVHS